MARDPARWVKRGVFGLAVLAASRWLWQVGGVQSSPTKTPEKADGVKAGPSAAG